jgi:hypothetical protein
MIRLVWTPSSPWPRTSPSTVKGGNSLGRCWLDSSARHRLPWGDVGNACGACLIRFAPAARQHLLSGEVGGVLGARLIRLAPPARYRALIGATRFVPKRSDQTSSHFSEGHARLLELAGAVPPRLGPSIPPGRGNRCLLPARQRMRRPRRQRRQHRRRRWRRGWQQLRRWRRRSGREQRRRWA